MAGTSIPGVSVADVERVLGRLTVIITELAGITVEAAHGHTGYLIAKKRFAWLLVNHHDDGRVALWIKAPPGEQAALVSGDPVRYFVPPYLGARGWVGVGVAPADDPDWDEVAALIEQGWRMSAGKRVVAAWEAHRRGQR